MPGACNLTWLPLSAIGRPPNLPMIMIADGVAAAPELRGHPGVCAIPEHPAELAISD